MLPCNSLSRQDADELFRARNDPCRHVQVRDVSLNRWTSGSVVGHLECDIPIGTISLGSGRFFLYGKFMLKSSSDFGALIRARRKALGWTQVELAARCGTGERFIVELERGKATCHLEKALIAARVVGIELDDLKRKALPTELVEDVALAHLPHFGR